MVSIQALLLPVKAGFMKNFGGWPSLPCSRTVAMRALVSPITTQFRKADLHFEVSLLILPGLRDTKGRDEFSGRLAVSLRSFAGDALMVPDFLLWDRVQILEQANIIRGQQAILEANDISVHPTLVVSSKEPIHIQLDEILGFLFRKKRDLQCLLLANDSGVEGVLYKLQ